MAKLKVVKEVPKYPSIDEMEEFEDEMKFEDAIGATELVVSDVDYYTLRRAKRLIWKYRKAKYGRYAMQVLEHAIEYCIEQRARDQEKEFWK